MDGEQYHERTDDGEMWRAVEWEDNETVQEIQQQTKLETEQRYNGCLCETELTHAGWKLPHDITDASSTPNALL